MRLIDADAFKEYMWKALEETRGCYSDKGEWAEAITEQFCKDIDDQPTIDPERKKGKWIPVTERLPEENGLYLVTNVGRWVEPVGTRYYNIRADGGFWSGHPGDKVLAWMPLPKGYEG